MIVDYSILPDQAVFAIVNHEHKRVYISYSMSLKARIGIIYSELLEYINNEPVTLTILDTCPDREHLELFVGYWVSQYLSLGYTLYRRNKPHRTYRVSIQINKRFKEVQVILYDRRYKPTVVGIFTSIPEAQSFVDTYYKGELILPIYALNSTTRERCKESYTDVRRFIR